MVVAVSRITASSAAGQDSFNVGGIEAMKSLASSPIKASMSGSLRSKTTVEEIRMIELKVNGQPRRLDVDADTPLLWALRDTLRMTGTKYGCGEGFCGACTVHVDGVAQHACQTPVSAAAGHDIVTIEAIGADRVGRAVQDAWRDIDVVQCGYCQSGQIMSATALLRGNGRPSDADIDAAMAGNLCRCATYVRIRAAIHQAAAALGENHG
jgi:isoquinoline 1-oxidoreductase alpha subunit